MSVADWIVEDPPLAGGMKPNNTNGGIEEIGEVPLILIFQKPSGAQPERA